MFAHTHFIPRLYTYASVCVCIRSKGPLVAQYRSSHMTAVPRYLVRDMSIPCDTLN